MNIQPEYHEKDDTAETSDDSTESPNLTLTQRVRDFWRPA
jgi:hypothetical protein